MRFLSDKSTKQVLVFCGIHLFRVSMIFSISRSYFSYYTSTGAEKEDFYEQIPIMMREMLYRLNDDNEAVLKANHAAWTSLSNKVPAEELVKHVEFMKGLIASLVSDARRRKGGVGDGEFLLPGLNMTKGTLPLFPCLSLRETELMKSLQNMVRHALWGFFTISLPDRTLLPSTLLFYVVNTAADLSRS